MTDLIRAALERLVFDIDCLVDSSSGVAGLHLNGDIAPWAELMESGGFSSWVGDAIAIARVALAAAPVVKDSLTTAPAAEGEAAAADYVPGATKMVGAVPAAEGEVAELVVELHRICFDVPLWDCDTITRAAELLRHQAADVDALRGRLSRAISLLSADLLEQRQAAPVPVPVSERLPDWRGLCEELANYLQGRKDHEVGWPGEDLEQDLLDRVHALLAHPAPAAGAAAAADHVPVVKESLTAAPPAEGEAAAADHVPGARDMVGAAPAAEGKVAELVAWLRSLRSPFCDGSEWMAGQFDCAADLLERQAAPVPAGWEAAELAAAPVVKDSLTTAPQDAPPTPAAGVADPLGTFIAAQRPMDPEVAAAVAPETRWDLYDSTQPPADGPAVLESREPAAVATEAIDRTQSLPDIALEMLGTIERTKLFIPEITDTIRKALEQLSTAHPERLRHCPTHGQQPATAWGCPECVRELREQLSATPPAPVPAGEHQAASVPVSGWQPIGTAPKNGTEILVSDYDAIEIVSWENPPGEAPGWYTREGEAASPAWWQPLADHPSLPLPTPEPRP